MTFGRKVLFKEKIPHSQANFPHSPATTPPARLQPSTIQSQDTARKLLNTIPEALGGGRGSATLMHNLRTYTISVNSGLGFSCINEFQGSIKIWIQILKKTLQTKNSVFF